MKIALLGKGKTGSKVLEVAIEDEVTIFDSTNQPTLEKLAGHDVVISFLPGDIFIEYIDLLIESKIPVVTGSTGMTWPKNLSQRLEENNIVWIYGHNFALGMNVVKLMIEKMSLLKKLFNSFDTNVHEVHHIHKKDSPSGTAIHWDNWFGGVDKITADREGDVVGFHEIVFNSETETIKLSHDAKDRAIFAQGALWAAKIINTNNVTNGLNQFNEVVRSYLKI